MVENVKIGLTPLDTIPASDSQPATLPLQVPRYATRRRTGKNQM